MKMELSIVVPCYNESKNLERLISAFRDAIGSQSGIEVVLVDNGSRDDTSVVLEKLLSVEGNAFARSVKVDLNQGYGHGIMHGLRSSSGEFLSWTHADLQTPPEDVLRAHETIRSMTNPVNSLVRGHRKGRPLFDQLFTSAMGWYASFALGSHLYDVNAQPKVFHHSLLSKMDQAPADFTLDLYLLFLANRLGFDVRTVDVRFESRSAGVAKGGGSLTGKFKLTKRTFFQIRNLRRKLTTGTLPIGNSDLKIENSSDFLPRKAA